MDVRAFFAERAAGWEERFPDDGPAYQAAVATLTGRVLDAGCGTGRAMPYLEQGVGVDLTPEMLAEAARRGRGPLVHGDVRRLPFPAGAFDGVLAAGLVSHLGDEGGGLRELARVTRAGGRLVLFHPVGRAVLAARHGRPVDPTWGEPEVRTVLAAAGWTAETVDDGPDRYLVLARRDG